MVVLELEEGSNTRLLIDNDWQDQACVELCRSIKVDLAEKTCKICHWFSISLDLSAKTVDLLGGKITN